MKLISRATITKRSFISNNNNNVSIHVAFLISNWNTDKWNMTSFLAPDSEGKWKAPRYANTEHWGLGWLSWCIKVFAGDVKHFLYLMGGGVSSPASQLTAEPQGGNKESVWPHVIKLSQWIPVEDSETTLGETGESREDFFNRITARITAKLKAWWEIIWCMRWGQRSFAFNILFHRLTMGTDIRGFSTKGDVLCRFHSV